MPILDNETMLRDGATAVTGTESGSWVKVGKSPFHGLCVFVHLPSDGTTITIDVEQADDSSGTNSESIPNSAFPVTITAGEDSFFYPVALTRPYASCDIDAVTGDFGAVQVGFMLGDEYDGS